MMESVQTKLAASGNYGSSRTAADIKYLVIHYTGNDGDSAANNADYFQDTVVEASAHFFVDDDHIYKSVPELAVAWAVGGRKYANADKTGGGTMYGIVTNRNSISIELCDTVKDGTYRATEATLQNAAELAVVLMRWYSIPLENVYRHFDVTGKHCPSYMVSEAPWKAFKERIRAAMVDNTPSPAHVEGVEWAVKRGILRGNDEGDLMLHDPLTREQFCTMLHRALGTN